jgi:hypothetical protein
MFLFYSYFMGLVSPQTARGALHVPQTVCVAYSCLAPEGVPFFSSEEALGRAVGSVQMCPSPPATVGVTYDCFSPTD